jgi:uncharacterized protein with FMN-binding domain
MSYNQPRRGSGFLLALRKVFASAFIIVTFGAYAIHDRTTAQSSQLDGNTLPLPTDTGAGADLSASPTTVAMVPTPTATDAPSSTPVPPRATNLPSTATSIPIKVNQPSQVQATVVPSSTPIPPSATPFPTATKIPPTPTQSGQYCNGQFTGIVANAFYGTVQVKAIISGGRISDVQFLDYPHDRRTSQFINQQATPWLRQEAIQAQNAQVNIISGATLTSRAFIQSLQSALSQAG